MIWLESSSITDDIEMGGCDCSLAHALTHNKIIIPYKREKRKKKKEMKRKSKSFSLHVDLQARSHHSGLVTTVSTTVPGGGFLRSP